MLHCWGPHRWSSQSCKNEVWDEGRRVRVCMSDAGKPRFKALSGPTESLPQDRQCHGYHKPHSGALAVRKERGSRCELPDCGEGSPLNILEGSPGTGGEKLVIQRIAGTRILSPLRSYIPRKYNGFLFDPVNQPLEGRRASAQKARKAPAQETQCWGCGGAAHALIWDILAESLTVICPALTELGLGIPPRREHTASTEG